MSYVNAEYSENDGNPRELYRFVHENIKWLYTSGQKDIYFQNELYKPEVISRNSIEQTNNLRRTGIEIKVPRHLKLASSFLSSPFNSVISITIFRTHVTDTSKEFVTYWKGRISGGYLSGSEVVFSCEPIASSLNRIGLRAHYQLLCRHVLYDKSCRALKDSYKTSGVIFDIDDCKINISEASNKPDKYYAGGLLTTLAGSRLIVKHESSSITISSPLIGLSIGMDVQLYAGCNHSVGQCKNSFNNLDNFGGFPFIPAKNPFSGDAII